MNTGAGDEGVALSARATRAPIYAEEEITRGYAYATWLLTGERRSYSASSGTFGRVVPRNAIDEGGFGAIEIGARVDYLDLSDLGPDAGAQVGASLVVNDYLTKRLRATADYSYTRVIDGPIEGTDVHALTFRLQFAY